MTHRRKDTHWALLLLLVLAICGGLRLFSLCRAEDLSPDGVIYIAQGIEFTQSPAKALEHYVYHPGYSALVAAGGLCLDAQTRDDWILIGRGVSVAMSLLAISALFAVGRQIGPTPHALVSAALFGLGREFVEYGGDVVSDPTALALALSALAMALASGNQVARNQRRAALSAIAVGLLLGLGYLVRPEVLALLPVAILGFYLQFRKTRPRPRLVLVSALGLLLALALSVGPYMWVIGGLTGKKSLGDLVGLGGGGILGQLPLAAPAPGDALIRLADRLRQAGGNVTAFLTVITLATWIGRYALRLKLPPRVVHRPRGAMVLLPGLALGVFSALLLGLELNHQDRYISSRHALIPAAMLALLAGPGFFTIVEWLVAFRTHLGFRPLRKATSAVCLIIGLGLAALPALLSVPHEGKAIYRQAGRYPAQGSGKYWLSHEMVLAYHAGCPIEQLRQRGEDSCVLHPRHMRNAETLLARARANAHEVTYVALPASVTLKDGTEIPICDLLLGHERFVHLTEASSGKTHIHVFRLLQDASPGNH